MANIEQVDEKAKEQFKKRIIDNSERLSHEENIRRIKKQIGREFDDAYDGGIYLKSCLENRLKDIGVDATPEQIEELSMWKSVHINGSDYQMEQVEDADGEISDDGPRSFYRLVQVGWMIVDPIPPPIPHPIPEPPKKKKEEIPPSKKADKNQRRKARIIGAIIPIIIVFGSVKACQQTNENDPSQNEPGIETPENDPNQELPEGTPKLPKETPELPDGVPEFPFENPRTPEEENVLVPNLPDDIPSIPSPVPENENDELFAGQGLENETVEQKHYILSKIISPSLFTEPSAEKAGQEEMLDIYKYGLGPQNLYDPVKHAQREEEALEGSQEAAELIKEYDYFIEHLADEGTDQLASLERMKEIMLWLDKYSMKQQGVFHKTVEDFNNATPDVPDVGRDRTDDVKENDKRIEEFLLQNMDNIRRNITIIDEVLSLLEEQHSVDGTIDHGAAHEITLSKIAKVVEEHLKETPRPSTTEEPDFEELQSSYARELQKHGIEPPVFYTKKGAEKLEKPLYDDNER